MAANFAWVRLLFEQKRQILPRPAANLTYEIADGDFSNRALSALSRLNFIVRQDRGRDRLSTEMRPIHRDLKES